jgi:hypothetical protein
MALVAVAVNSGNMGTLVRHRAFGLPYVGTFAALGVTAVLARFGAPSGGAPESPHETVDVGFRSRK